LQFNRVVLVTGTALIVWSQSASSPEPPIGAFAVSTGAASVFAGGSGAAWVARYDRVSGAEVYRRTLGANPRDAVLALAVSPDGVTHAAGERWRDGIRGGFVSLLTAAGGVVATYPFPEPVTALAIDPAGRLIAASGAQLVDLQGWWIDAPGPVAALVFDARGRIFAGGRKPATVDTGGSGEDGYVARLAEDAASFDSVITIGGTGPRDAVRALAVGPDGALHAAGHTDSTDLATGIAPSSAQHGGLDGFVARITPGGASVEWLAHLGGSADDSSAALGFDARGRVLATGWTRSANFAGAAGWRGSEDGFLARIDANGAVVRASYLGESGRDMLAAMAGGGGEVFLAGGSERTPDGEWLLRVDTESFKAAVPAAGAKLPREASGPQPRQSGSLVVVGGDAQSTRAGTRFTTLLSAYLSDGAPDVPMTFTITPGTATGSFPQGATVVQSTDLYGLAVATPVTAGPNAGTFTVTASAPTYTPAVFTLTVRATSSCRATDTVTNLTDTGAVGTLREAVSQACSGATITIPATGVETIGLTQGEMYVAEPLTIRTSPSSAAILGGRAFFVDTGADLNLFGIDFGGSSAGGGDGHASLHGGSGNGGSGGGAGMGGVIFVNGGSLTLDNVDMIENFASGGDGGAATSYGGAATSGVTCAFGGASVGPGSSTHPGRGGNILDGAASTATGVAGGYGAGGSTFCDGTLAPPGFGGGAAAANSSGGRGGSGFGGGLFARSGLLRLLNTSFGSNGALRGTGPGGNGIAKGGGIYLDAAARLQYTNLTLSSNIAADHAGTPTDNADVFIAAGAVYQQVGTPVTLTKTAGDNQAAAINTAFTTALSVEVKDASNIALFNVPVTFTAPASGASASLNGAAPERTRGLVVVKTNASGVAQVTAAANGTAGAYSVTASTPGAGNAVFSLTNTTGGSTTVTLTGGPSPRSFGQSASFTASINGAASGLMTFMDGPEVLGSSSLITSVASTAGLNTRLLQAGSRSVRAVYNGDGSNPAGVSNTLPVTVNAALASSFAGVVNYTTGTNPRFVATGDFNGDGRTDVVTSNQDSNNASILLGNGDGTFGAAATIITGSQPGAVAAADFNRDGRTDLAFCDRKNAEVRVLLGVGNGTFGAAAAFATPGSINNAIGVTDLNLDSRADIVVASTNSATVHVLRGNGDGTFAAAVSNATGAGPRGLAIADFNLDGRFDVITANTSTLSLLRGNGDGTFAAATNIAAPATAAGIVTADFNADGRPDIALPLGAAQNQVAVGLGDGTGSYSSFVNYGTGTTPSAAAVGDFNGDGRIDIATANAGTGNVSILRGAASPAGTFLPKVDHNTGNTPVALATVELNGDFRSDLAVGNSLGNDVGVLLGILTTTVTVTQPANVPFSAANQNVTLTAAVTSGGDPVTTGTLTFTLKRGTTTIGSAVSGVALNASGVGSTPYTIPGGTTVGAITVQVDYVGAGGFPNSSDASRTFDITQTPASVTATGGTPQSATINTAYATSLAATVRDASNAPVPGVTVTFTAPGFGASVTFPSGATAVTNASGVASVPVTANGSPGGFQVSAAVAGVTTAATFALTNTTAVTLVVTQPANVPFSAAAQNVNLQASVAALGNPVVSGTLTFTLRRGAATIGSAVSGVTLNAAGVGSTVYSIPGGTAAGAVTVQVDYSGFPGFLAASDSTKTFDITAAGGNTVTATGGSGQSAALNTDFATQIQATVRDGNNNPVAGVTVTFTAPGAGASATFPGGATGVTGANGVAAVTARANGTAGTYTVNASIGGTAPPAAFTLTNTAPPVVTAAQPANVALSLSAQNAALQATVTAGGVPVATGTLTFTLRRGATVIGSPVSGVALNASGVGSANYSIPGSTAAGALTLQVDHSSGASDSSKTLTIVAVPGSVAIGGGSGQSTPISEAFANPLQAVVRDPLGNTLPNATVTFTAPTTGASAVFANGTNTIQVVTGATGIVSVPVRANAAAGTYIVTATVAGVTAGANFTLTNSASPVTVSTLPDGQTFVVDGTTYTAPRTFQWAPGSRHTITAVNGPAVNGTRLLWTSWSDGGAISHEVVAPNGPGSFQARYRTQYQLTLIVNPAGGGTLAASPASADGFYDNLTPVDVAATAAAGFQFGGFTGALQGLINPQTVSMIQPRTVTATFGVPTPGGGGTSPATPPGPTQPGTTRETNLGVVQVTGPPGRVGATYDWSTSLTNPEFPALPALDIGFTNPAGLPDGIQMIRPGRFAGIPRVAGTFTFDVPGRWVFSSADRSEIVTFVYRVTILVEDVVGGLSVESGGLNFEFPLDAATRTTAKPGATRAAGENNANTRFIKVINRGSRARSVSVNASTFRGGPWLAASGGGSVGPFSSSTIVVTASPAGLGEGVFSGTVAIRAADGGNERFDLAVNLGMTRQRQILRVSRSGFTFEYEQGSTASVTQFFQVSSGGPGPLPFTSSFSTLSGGSWLSLAGGSGTAAADAPQSVGVSVNASTLAPGEYHGQIEVRAGEGVANSPATVNVVLAVRNRGVDSPPFVAPTGVFLVQRPQEPSPRETFTVTNTSSRVISFSLAGGFGEGPRGWFTASAPSFTVAPGQSVTVTVVRDPNVRLPAGGTTGEVVVRFSTGVTRRVAVGAIVLPTVPGASDKGASVRSAEGCTPARLVPLFAALGAGFSVVAGWPSALEMRVLDDCGDPLSRGVVTVSFSTGDPPLSLSPVGGGRWAGTWQPKAGTRNAVLTANALSESAPQLSGSAQIGGELGAGSAAPVVETNGIASAASFLRNAPVAPGSYIAVFGKALATGLSVADALPFAPDLAGTQVLLSGRRLPLQFTSDGQVNGVIPYDVPVNGVLQLVVRRGTAYSTPEPVMVARAQPAVFTRDQSGTGEGMVVAVRPDGSQSLIGRASPAEAGDVLVISCAGLGPVSPAVAAGSAAPSSPPAATVDPVRVTVGGREATVQFAGLAPGFAGLYQVNAVLPAGVSGDAVELVIETAGQRSAPVTIAVR